MSIYLNMIILQINNKIMKQLFKYLFIGTFLISCSPKYTELNDQGFGGGFGNTHLAKIKVKNEPKEIINISKENATSNLIIFPHIENEESQELSKGKTKNTGKQSFKSLKFNKKQLIQSCLQGKLKFSPNKKSKKAFDFLPYSDKPLFVQISIALGLLCILGFFGVLFYYLFIVARYLDIGLVLLGLGLLMILFGNWIDYMVEEEIGGKFFVVCLQLFLIFVAIVMMFLLVPGALMM